jgi:hypothetical protein
MHFFANFGFQFCSRQYLQCCNLSFFLIFQNIYFWYVLPCIFSLIIIYIIDVIQLSRFLCMLVWWYKYFSTLSDNTIECWVLIGTGVWIFSLLNFLCICALWFKLVVIWTSFFYLYINFPPLFFGLLFLLEVLSFPFF